MAALRALLAAAWIFMTAAPGGQAAETYIAVAANFTAAAREIAAAFKRQSGDEAVLSFGSSGQLYAQIVQGAPFSAMLSADALRPEQLVDADAGVAGTRFTYAVGKLALWSRGADAAGGERTLRSGAFNRLAIANPATAPYGAAAVETLKSLGLDQALGPKLVQGNSIAQAYQFVATGNAELGFVALSQVIGREEGSSWVVPQGLYAPIRQDAVLLRRGKADEAAHAFLSFLKGPVARGIIQRYGYGTAE